ncbi:MAG: hypothetical protein AAF327_03890 [Cyanobacteria bacterium P01_A01_bin.37]
MSSPPCIQCRVSSIALSHHILPNVEGRSPFFAFMMIFLQSG